MSFAVSCTQAWSSSISKNFYIQVISQIFNGIWIWVLAGSLRDFLKPDQCWLGDKLSCWIGLCDVHLVTIEKRLLLQIMIVYCVVSSIMLFMAMLFVIWMTFCVPLHGTDAGRKFAWMQHERTWKRENMTQNRTRTPTSQNKTSGSYLTEGLLLCTSDSLTNVLLQNLPVWLQWLLAYPDSVFARIFKQGWCYMSDELRLITHTT